MQLKKYKNIKLEMRRLLALFIGIILFVAPVFSQKKEAYKVQTVVIDPGHGGAKPGAIGSKTSEKAIVLSIAKKFGKLISDNYPDVRVIYTRTTDVDISLAERAHIANRNKADLFISVHANSHPTSSPTGVETFVMGLSESRANLEVAKKENADILLEADYKSNEAYKGFDPNAPESFVMLAMYQNAFIDKSLNFAQAIQNQYKKNLKTINRGVKQAELFVLYKTTCPSVLTEVGFISNPGEEAFMMSDEGQAKIAISLFNAFMNFKATEEGTNRIVDPKIDLPGYEMPKKTVDQIPETPQIADAAIPERPVPTSELAPRVEIAAEPPTVKETVEAPEPVVIQSEPKVEPQPEPKVEVAPVPVSKPEPQQEPQPEPQPAPKVQRSSANLKAPRNTAVSATEFFTVQFLTSNNELRGDDPAFEGLSNVMTTRNGQLYCYSVGRFATFSEADEYANELRKNTSFSDAWAVRRKLSTPAPEPKPEPKEEAKPAPKPEPQVEAKPAPKPEVKPAQQPKPAPKQVAADDRGMHYRIQLCTSSSYFKPGAPELAGIKDVYHVQNGKSHVYSCGNYTSLEEARKRLATITKTTPFKDAFIFGIKDGKRIKLE